MKRIIVILVFIAVSVESYCQVTFTQEMSEGELEQVKFRKQNRIKTYKMLSKDSSYYYLEEYDENGHLIAHRDIDFDKTVYEYNNKGKRIFCYEMIENKPDNCMESLL